MGETTALPATLERSPHDEWRDRWWRVVGMTVVAVAVLSAGLLVVTGEKPSTYGSLLDGVAKGRVTSVEVVSGADGSTTEVHWDGLVDRYAPIEVTDGRAFDLWHPVYNTAENPTETLRGINPDLRISRADTLDDGAWSPDGWRAPGPVLLLLAAAWVATLLLLVGGPKPWRATRWAWFWVLCAGPLGALAYLALGGPLGVGRPARPDRRVTGGWAFVLVAVLTAVWPVV